MKFRNPDDLGTALLLLIPGHLKMTDGRQADRKREKRKLHKIALKYAKMCPFKDHVIREGER